jgi:hypothetical protein
MTTYVTNCLTSIYGPSLRPLLVALNVVILDERADNGFTTTRIDCDSTTAEKIDLAGFHITKAT